MSCVNDRKRQIRRLLLWIMAFYYFWVITKFSAQNAVTSSSVSNGIIDRIILFLTGIAADDIDKEVLFFLHALIRKIAHFTNFFILGFLYIMLASDISDAVRRVLCTVLVCGLLSATIDELHQYFVPGRSAQPGDVLIDFFGVVTGCMTFISMRKVFKC